MNLLEKGVGKAKKTQKPAPKTLSDQEKINWIRLIGTENVGPTTFYHLLQRFKTAEYALKRLPRMNHWEQGGPKKTPSQDDAAHILDLCHKNNIHLLAYGEDAYPKSLAALNDAPPLLSAKGKLSLLAKPSLSIVGSRNASGLGTQLAFDWAQDLGKAGITITSGLAQGIDGSAHRGSLTTGTIAVLAAGVETVYPPEHETLYRQIQEQGLLLAENLPGTNLSAGLFAKRNRIIAGLSWGVLVVEAALKSGSLLTAHFAIQQGREVFAVPGHPSDPRAAGTSKLIREGAILVTCPADILSERPKLEQRVGDIAPTPQSFEVSISDADVDKALFRLQGILKKTPTTLDTLCAMTDMSEPIVRAAVIELEIAGVARLNMDNTVSIENDRCQKAC